MKAGLAVSVCLATMAVAGLCLSLAAGPAAAQAVGSSLVAFGPATGGRDLLAGSTGSGATSGARIPLVLDRRRILAYQASFVPAPAGLFPPRGGAVTPRGVVAGRGLVLLEVDTQTVVPGSVFALRYRTKAGTLQGNVDVYFAVRIPTGQLLYVTGGGLGPGLAPFRSDVAIADETVPLVTVKVPGDLPFGAYTFYMALVYTGADASDPANLASAVSELQVTNAALSPEQEELLAARGNPDFFAVFWFDEAIQRRESWLYLSGTPTRFAFVDGALESEEAVADAAGPPGPKIDPRLFTPQTTLAALTAALGPPASVGSVAGAPGYQRVAYASGLTVLFRDGRLGSALTITP